MDLVYVVIGVLLLIGGAGAWYLRRKSPKLVETLLQTWVIKKDDTWDAKEAVHQLVAETEGLQRLYARLGYNLDVEKQVEECMQALKAQIHAQVPDFAALQNALEKAPPLSQAVPVATTISAEDPHPAEVLLHNVLTAGADEERVHALLNQAPVEDALPFAEVLPVKQGGRVVWRPVMEVTLVRKVPTDSVRFKEILDDLESLVQASRLARTVKARNAVLEALARLRAVLKQPSANVPLALNSLEEQVKQWLKRAHLQEPYARKQVLDEILRLVVTLRHTYSPPRRKSRMLDAAALAAFKTQAQQHAAAYLDAPWMHEVHITELFLLDLLDAELAAFPEREHYRAMAPARVLRFVRDEVASGFYDTAEEIRRLRELEAHDLFVHSFIYSLLRLPAIKEKLGD